MMTATVSIPKSVASYEDECAAILSWLSADKWLDQHEFDGLSLAWRHPVGGHPRKAAFMTEGTIAPPFQGDLLILILQEFQAVGIVEARKKAGVIGYRLIEAERA